MAGTRARLLRLVPAGRAELVLAVLAVVLLLLLVVGVAVDARLVAAAAGVLLPCVAAGLLSRAAAAYPARAALVRVQFPSLLAAQDALVLAAVLGSGRLAPGARALVVVAVAALQALRVAYGVLQLVDDVQQAGRVDARLAEPLPALPARPRLLRPGGAAAAVLASVPLPLALAVGRPPQRPWLVAAGAVLGVLLVLALVAASAPVLLRHRRLTRGGARLSLVREAVMRHEPLAVLYLAGGPEDAFCISQWFGTLERLPTPSVVMVRDPAVLDALPPTSVPIVCLPAASDVWAFELHSARVSLFVVNRPENTRLLSGRGLRSAFIGHGDSDKIVSTSPLIKGYDEVWVAGEAGRQRLLTAGYGIRAEAIRLVGRPQTYRVQGPRPPGQEPRYAVLYAPSWEGIGGEPLESSLLHSGLDIVRVLLALADVRLVYRAHPKTGQRNPAFAARHREIVRLVEQAGTPHEVSSPQVADLVDTFNGVDALVADLSGVLTDFLASDKPYFVVNAGGTPDEEFRARYPSTAGAYLLGPGAEGLEAALGEARGSDRQRPARLATRTALLGPPTDDAVRPFADAVAALARRQP